MHLFIFLFFSMLAVRAQEVHFFGSLDYARTTTKNDVEYGSIKNNFSASNLDTAGINVSAKFNESTQGLVQVIHSPIPNKFSADLIQFQRTFAGDFKVRVGKQRTPIFLKSEVIQVKALYPWVTPPVQVYGQNPIRSFDGASVEKAWDKVALQVYGGSINEELFVGDLLADVKGSDLVGARLNYTNEAFESFLHYSRHRSTTTIHADAPLGGGVTGKTEIELDFKRSEVLSGGMSYDTRNWLFMSEYIHLISSNPSVKVAQAAYGSIGHHFTEKFLALTTYATELERVSNSSPSPTTSYDLTLQYSLDENTSLKLGFTHVNFQRKVKTSGLGAVESGVGFTGAPGGNFDIYDLQLAFVF